MSDLISRQDAIRWVKTECNPYGKPTLDFESGKRVMEHLEQMPSAEPKTGEWDLCKDDDGVYGVCSICGCYVDFSLYGRPYKVCPHCGAKMLGEDGEA